MCTEHVQSRAESKRHTTAKVVEAAQTLFRRVGYRETTVRQISAAAGVSVGAVMAVGGKESLLIMVYDDEIMRRVDARPE
jgi:AcrR family transcriptional regulator